MSWSPLTAARYRSPYRTAALVARTCKPLYIRTALSKHKSAEEQCLAYRWFRETIETIRDFSILDYTAPAHAIFQSLQQQKIRIGSQDLRIAAITLSVGGVLATRKQIDFGQIPDLVTEDWSK